MCLTQSSGDGHPPENTRQPLLTTFSSYELIQRSSGLLPFGEPYLLPSVFAWLALLRKAPTTNNLVVKGWPCNPSCALCYCEPEMIDHVLTECNFTEAVWDRVVQEFQVHEALIPFQKGKISDGIAALARIPSKRQQRINARIVFSFTGGSCGRSGIEELLRTRNVPSFK
jgi:hypothetical protein